jgi:hypothetical protein
MSKRGYDGRVHGLEKHSTNVTFAMMRLAKDVAKLKRSHRLVLALLIWNVILGVLAFWGLWNVN